MTRRQLMSAVGRTACAITSGSALGYTASVGRSTEHPKRILQDDYYPYYYGKDVFVHYSYGAGEYHLTSRDRGKTYTEVTVVPGGGIVLKDGNHLFLKINPGFGAIDDCCDWVEGTLFGLAERLGIR